MTQFIRAESWWKLGPGAVSGDYIIGSGSDSMVSAFHVHIVDTGSLSATIDVKSRSAVNQAAVDNVAFNKTVYAATWINGAQGDGSVVSTQITTTSSILIPATGQQIALTIAYTSGTATIYVLAVAGASVL